jgi:CubicO group peptidase (beta-lactamase class C family)
MGSHCLWFCGVSMNRVLPSPALLSGMVFVMAAAISGYADPPKAKSEKPYDQKVDGDRELHEIAKKLIAEHQLPGMVVAVATADGVVAKGAAGLRKLGSDVRFTADDQVHIGSCTKAMTAALIGIFVDEGKISWDSTIEECLPELSKEIHPDFRKATVAQLLSHRTGMDANADWWNLSGDSTTQQRVTLVKELLAKAPPHPVGDFLYSNCGYAVAAVMLETKTGKSWEDLIQERIFKPLKMESAGFGPPGTPWRNDQPWGHTNALGVKVPRQLDNAPPLGPAGRVHLTIDDWGKFIAAELKGLRGHDTAIGKSATVKREHVPSSDDQHYGLGWLIVDRPWAKGTSGEGKAHTHTGSNTMWFAVVWMAPAKDFAVMAATNTAGESGGAGCDGAASALIKWWGEKKK